MAAPESYPDDLRYHSDHDWARIEGGEATLGITWFAQDALGELVHYEAPEAGATVSKGGQTAANVRPRDTGAHETSTQNADALHGARLHRTIRHAWILRQTRPLEEDSDQIARDGAADQRHETLRLSLEPLAQRQQVGVPDPETSDRKHLDSYLEDNSEDHVDGQEIEQLRQLLDEIEARQKK